MYIDKVTIKNIRSIETFEMTFPEQPGWHVVIGDNGSGKSTIVRAIALGLIGPVDSKSLRLNLREWIRRDALSESCVALTIQRNDEDGYLGRRKPQTRPFEARVTIKTDDKKTVPYLIGNEKGSTFVWSNTAGWFSAAFGPFRRFTGGEKEWMKVYYSDPRAAAHLSVFGEDVALTEAIQWFKELNYKKLEKAYNNAPDPASENELLKWLLKFLNNGGLLPHNTRLRDITSEGIFFTDGNGYDVEVTELSDGFRSLLSLTFELLRQLIRSYGQEAVFKNFEKEIFTIDLPGVILIDEIDAHLHPSWQTRIGSWFTKYFPRIQFIVTTHSPLVCRASEKGSIWRLRTPGSSKESGQVTGIDRERLIFGDLLDAYGTELFGRNITQSVSGQEMAKEMAELSLKSFKGTINEEEKKRLNELKSIMPTVE